jgi:lipopolysaccharide export system permease protein
MSILTRYILRAHVGPFFFSLSLLTGLLLVNTVARRFEELAGKGLSAGVIAEVFVLSIPHILALTLPMAVLVAVLHAFSHLAAENEISALKANGVSLVRLVLPLVGVAAALAGGMVLFNDRVLPETNHALKNLLVDIGRKSPTLELKEQVINEIRTGDLRTRYFLQAARIDPASNRLFDVVIYDLSAPGRGRTVYADSGRMAFNHERTDLFLTLHDGWVNELADAEPDAFQRLYFDRQLVRLAGVGNELQRTTDVTYRSDREMSLTLLAEEVTQRRTELTELRERAAQESQRALEAVLNPTRWQEVSAAQESGSRPRAGAAADTPQPAAPGQGELQPPLRRPLPVPGLDMEAGGLARPTRMARDRGLEQPAREWPGQEQPAPERVTPEEPELLAQQQPAPERVTREGPDLLAQQQPAPEQPVAREWPGQEQPAPERVAPALRVAPQGGQAIRPAEPITRGRASRGAGVLHDDLTRRTSSELRSLTGRADILQLRIWSFQVEYHKKYAIPFACIVFVLIGAPLAVRFPRGGIGFVIAASLTIFMIYYVGLIGGENLADNGRVNPFVAMWFTNMVFFTLGLWAMTRLGKEMATTRGGGFEDLWITLRGMARRPFRRRRSA